MIQVIIGHRGVGKSSLGKRMQLFFPGLIVIDLDEWIEKSEQKSIADIFQHEGESIFRELEQTYFNEIHQSFLKRNQTSGIIIVGAGFFVEKLPSDVEVLFLQRKTDSIGRIFFNRVRLDPTKTPIEEYLDRYEGRQKKYQEHHDFCYHLPEGITEYFFEMDRFKVTAEESVIFSVEKSILNRNFQTRFGYTLQKQDVKKTTRWNILRSFVENKQIGFLELRDDLFSHDDILKILHELPPYSVLLSFRTEKSLQLAAQVTDWSIMKLWGVDCDELFFHETILNSFQSVPFKIISSHGEVPPQISLPSGWILKWSPQLNTWSELDHAMKWHSNRDETIFLPRSEKGRWDWIRLLLAPSQKLNFMALSNCSALDQPTLFQCLLFRSLEFNSKLAGILGFPTVHSFSPVFHSDFFARKKIPYLAFSIEADEWDQAMNFFEHFKDRFLLSYASVTSPLKERAAKFWSNGSEHKACNTMIHSRKTGSYKAYNTDELGFIKAFEPHLQGHVLMWGGGGMIEVIRSACLKMGVLSFTQISSRHPRYEGFDFNRKYVLVWGAPSSELTQYPNKEIEILKILDLNYFEFSFGRNLALAKKIEYHSGFEMFCEQALLQQKIWREE